MERINKKTIIFSIIILTGLALSVYAALNYQNILSRADSANYNYFNVSQENGQPVHCESNGTCPTQSLKVKLQINNLDQLSQ